MQFVEGFCGSESGGGNGQLVQENYCDGDSACLAPWEGGGGVMNTKNPSSTRSGIRATIPKVAILAMRLFVTERRLQSVIRSLPCSEKCARTDQ